MFELDPEIDDLKNLEESLNEDDSEVEDDLDEELDEELDEDLDDDDNIEGFRGRRMAMMIKRMMKKARGMSGFRRRMMMKKIKRMKRRMSRFTDGADNKVIKIVLLIIALLIFLSVYFPNIGKSLRKILGIN